jgi:hypothetical protein
MSKGLWIALGVVGVFVLALLMVFGSYVSARNQMVAKDQAVKSKWSEVDVQLERRADLIPNLVETVKGFTKEESTVFVALITTEKTPDSSRANCRETWRLMATSAWMSCWRWC